MIAGEVAGITAAAAAPAASEPVVQKEKVAEPEQSAVPEQTVVPKEAAAPVIEQKIAAASPAPVPETVAPPAPVEADNGTNGHSLAKVSNVKPHHEDPSTLDRVLKVARFVVPVVQRVLPLLDGNIATAAANMLMSRPAPQVVDLDPIEKSLDKLKTAQAGLQEQVAAQSSRIKQLSTDLSALQEAAEERNAAISASLATLRKRVVILASVGAVLLAGSMAANVYLLLRMQHVIQ